MSDSTYTDRRACHAPIKFEGPAEPMANVTVEISREPPGTVERTWEPIEVAPLYTQAQMDAAVTRAVAAVNRSAGKSLLGMLNGVGDMARQGEVPAEDSVTEQLEMTIERLELRNHQLTELVIQKDEDIAALVAKFELMNQRLENLADHFGEEKI